jgi:hypothetical protein
MILSAPGRLRVWVHLLVCIPLCSSLAFVHPVMSAEQWMRGSFTGKEILAACKAASGESVHDFERGACRGFIEGFIAGRHVGDTVHAFHHRSERLETVYGRLCIPAKIDKSNLIFLFVVYLEKNPDKMNWNAGVLLETALQEAFPCPEE